MDKKTLRRGEAEWILPPTTTHLARLKAFRTCIWENVISYKLCSYNIYIQMGQQRKPAILLTFGLQHTKFSQGIKSIFFSRLDFFNQPRNQASFWSEFSTVDYLQVINELPEKMNEWNEPLYILFTNCEKDLNSVERNSVS